MSLSTTIYNTFFRSNAIMLTTVFAGAFGGQILMDTSANKIWDSVNKGRQWKDIKAKYVTAPEAEAEE